MRQKSKHDGGCKIEYQYGMCEKTLLCFSYYFPLALVFSVSPELKVLGTTRLLLPWVTAHGPEAASAASRWGLTISGFHLNAPIHLLPSSPLSHFLVTHLKATLPPDIHTAHTHICKVLQKFHKDTGVYNTSTNIEWHKYTGHSDSNTLIHKEACTHLVY